jgi:hypothetical protein
MNTEDRAWRRFYDNDLTLWYALVISFWSTFFLEFWKRRNNYLSYVWLTYNFEAEERPRHSFKPTSIVVSPVTGLPEPSFPTHWRVFRQLQSAVVISFFMFLVISSVVCQITFTLFLNMQTTISKDTISLLSGLFGLVIVIILKYFYKPVAYLLNHRENYHTEKQYEDGLILKSWLFNFVNVFSRLFY